MPFNHNDTYHPLLLRQVPSGARTALDVGCGAGKFARRLARAGLDVDGVDPAGTALGVARALGSAGPGTVTYHHEDITDMTLPRGHYGFISCVASLHHMPFETVTALRDALAPGGVLAVLGLAKPSSVTDWAVWLGSVPLDRVARGLVTLGERLNGGTDHAPPMPIKDWTMSMADIRRESARLLPGGRVRLLPFWRYLLTYRAT